MRRRTKSKSSKQPKGQKMPLVTCPDCSKQISDRVRACPQCGRPLRRQLSAGTKRWQTTRTVVIAVFFGGLVLIVAGVSVPNQTVGGIGMLASFLAAVFYVTARIT